MAYFNKKKTVRVPFSLSSLIGGTPSIGVPSNLPGVDFLVPMRYSSHEDLGVKRASPGPKTNRSVALEKSPHLKNKHSEPNVEDLGSKFVPLGLETNPTVTLEASPLQSLQSLQQFKSGEQEPDKTAIKNAKLHSQKVLNSYSSFENPIFGFRLLSD